MAAGLHWADYIIMVTFLCTSLGIGVYHALTGGRQRTTEEFIMANRNQRVIPTVLSLVVSYLSALLIIGGTAEMYQWGSHMAVVVCVSYSLALLLSERIILPWLYPLRLTSIFEYFHLRFNSMTVRIIASTIGVAWGVLYIGTAIYAPSAALEAATGFPLHASIPIMAVICTIYTAIGGMRAVIWTDVFQYVVMMVGMSAVLIKGSLAVGGLGNAMEECDKGGRLQWYNLDTSPTTRTTSLGILGMTMNFMYQFSFQQASFQRYTATKSLRNSRMVLWLTIPFVFIMFVVAYTTGLFVYAYYSRAACDPLASGIINNPNELLGLFVSTIFSNQAGFMGFFLATLYSGSLSSVSSSLSGAAANTWEDMLKWKLSHLSDYKATLINKALVVLYGLMGIGLAFLAASMPGPVTQICDAFLGAAGGPLFGMFLMGGVFRFTEWIGVTIGGCVSFVISLWICIKGSLALGHSQPLPPASVNGCSLFNLTHPETIYYNAANISQYNNFTSLHDGGAETNDISGIEQLYAVSFFWYAPIGIFSCLIVGLPISAIINCFKRKEDIPERVFIDWKQVVLCTCQEEELKGYNPKKLERGPGDEAIPMNRSGWDVEEEKNGEIL